MLARGLDPASIRALRDRLGATIGFGLLWFVLLPIVAVPAARHDRRNPLGAVPPTLWPRARVLDRLRGRRSRPRPPRRRGAT